MFSESMAQVEHCEFVLSIVDEFPRNTVDEICQWSALIRLFSGLKNDHLQAAINDIDSRVVSVQAVLDA
jgi:hypothetical protein